MDQILSQVALTSATFVGRAAWSYASGLAMKKITKQIEATTGNSKKLSNLEQKLNRKLAVLTPVIDEMELLQAQGRGDLQSILRFCDDLRNKLKKTSLIEPSEDDLIEIIEMIDDLIPLIGLSMSRNTPRTETKIDISYSRLLYASSALVTGDSIITYTTPSAPILIATPFPIRLYTMFEGSNRKNCASDTTWKEEFVKGTASVERVAKAGSRMYQLKITQDLEDGRYHDEDEVAATKLIAITDILKMFYTISGKLLNIEESTLPVLVLKLTFSEASADHKSKTATPKPASKTEWIALELYRDSPDTDDEADEDAKKILKNMKSLEIDSESISSKVTATPLDFLCSLEYLIRLCSLEMREFMSHTKVDDRIFNLYFASSENDFQTKQPVNAALNSNALGRSPAPTPTKRGSLLNRFLSD